MTFDTVITSVGGSWSGASNKFLIQSRGTYFFQLTIMGLYGPAGAYIRRDSTDIQEAFASGQHNIGVAAIAVQLDANTQISAYLGRGQVAGDGGARSFCHLTGFLLY